MKYLFFLLFSITSCNISTKKEIHVNNSQRLDNQSSFTKVINNNNSYALYYKIDQKKNNPVKLFTYYVSDNQSNKIVKISEQIAAENIYWKNNDTLAIIPYTDVMKKNDKVDEPNEPNEILISIK